MIYEGYVKLVEEQLKELEQLYSKEAGQRIIEQLLDDGLITPEQLNSVCDYLADIYFEDTLGGTPVYDVIAPSEGTTASPINKDEPEIDWEDKPIKEYTPEEELEDWKTYGPGSTDTDDTDTDGKAVKRS